MDNVMDKVFKIVYISAYAVGALALLIYLIGWIGFWPLVITYAVVIIVLLFLGYLIQEHLNNILQLYLIILGIVTIIGLFFKSGTWEKISLAVLGSVLLIISFVFDEYFRGEL